MTKNSPKKVLKIAQKPRRDRENYEIIRHFEPSESNAGSRTDLQAEIPRVNANIDDEGHKSKAITSVKRRRIIQIPNAYCANVPLQSVVGSQGHEQKSATKRGKTSKFKSSSSSSVDTNMEKFTNKARVKSKSFHAGQSKKTGQNKVIKSFTEKKQSPRLKSGSLRSVTDSALIMKELNLKSLKQEILDNRRVTSLERSQPSSNISKAPHSPKVQTLKEEINKSKTKDTLHKKILITELKTEISEYQRFNNYQIYNTHSSSVPNHESGGQNRQNPVLKSSKGTSACENSCGRRSRKGSEDVSYGSDRRNKHNSSDGEGGSPQRTSTGGENNDKRKRSLEDPERSNIKGKSRNESKDCCKKTDLRKNGPWQQETLRRDVVGSQTGTDKESSLDTTDDRRSDTTMEESCCQKLQPKNPPYSDSESIDDAVIRSKLEEANQLIDRVKKALDRMKVGKTTTQSKHVTKKVPESHTSSTDMEETIHNLTKETAKLMTSDNEVMLDPDLPKPKTRRGGRESTEKPPELPPDPAPNLNKDEISQGSGTSSSCNSLNQGFVKKYQERQSTGSSDESSQETVPKIVPKSRPSFARDLENARKKSAELTPDCCRNLDKLDMERPVTRRNETEGEVPEERILDKFRNCPEDGQLALNSSLEELQAKLQTISESTESSLSTPRNKKTLDKGVVKPKEVKCCACNTDTVTIKVKEVQVEPVKRSMGVTCRCPSENKGIQTIQENTRILVPCHIGVQSIIPPPLELVVTTMKTQEISPPKVKCEGCKLETLPAVEVAPFQEKILCDKCKKELQEEHLPGVCIPAKPNKRKQLTIKILPPISIDQKMTVKEVLNFFITPKGETQNLLEETENVTFFVMRRLDSGDKCSANEEEEEEEEEVEEYITNPGELKSQHSIRATNSEWMSAKKSSRFFLKIRDDAVKNIDFTDELVDDPAGKEQDLDEETQRKRLIYKSYHLCDNPNRHDPGGLDAKCAADMLSGIDVDFYKTFIDPTGNVSEKDMPFRSRANIALGFESKEVQCPSTTTTLGDEKMDKPTDKLTYNRGSASLHKPSSSKKLIFNLGKTTTSLHKHESDKKMSYEVIKPSAEYQIEESEITLLNVKPTGSENLPESTPTPIESLKPSGLSSSSMGRSSQEMEVTTPSEITVTISYSQSSEEGSGQNVKKLSRQSKETELKSTMFGVKLKLLESEATKNSIEKKLTDLGPTKKEKSTGLEKKSDSKDLQTSTKAREVEPEPKVISVKDKEVIQKIQEKLKTVDTDSSDPVLHLKRESLRRHTVDHFIKGLTRLTTMSDVVDEADVTSLDKEDTNSQNVNYHFIETAVDPKINLYSKHLMLAKNGRYKDEENLFTQRPHPKPTVTNRRSNSQNKDQEVENSKLEVYPKRILNRYSPDTTNSDTVTTNSLSEGEIRCKHTVSNGEIHVCRHGNPIDPHVKRNIPRSNLTSPSISPNHNTQRQRQILPRSNLTNSSISPNRYSSGQRNMFKRVSNSPHRNISNLKKFDLTDPNLTIEKRRNYFNNWVTYYLKPQEINDSSTSSSSQNK